MTTIQESGIYKCFAKSREGEAEDSVNVTVMEVPVMHGTQRNQTSVLATTIGIPILGFSIAGLVIFIIVSSLLVYRDMSQNSIRMATQQRKQREYNG